MKFTPGTFGLRGAVTLLVLFPLLVSFAIGSYSLLAMVEVRLEKRLQEDIALIARTLRVPLARAVERDRERSLDRALRSTYEFGRVYGVYVYGSDGEVLARADETMARDLPSLNSLDINHGETVGEYQSMDGREVYSYFTPLTDAGGQVIGMLQITRRASEIRDYIDAFRFDALVIMFLFSALFLVIVTLGYHVAVGRPLRALAGTMEEIADGDTSLRAAESGPHEIRWLSRRFNLMLNGISRRDAALARERRQQLRLQAQLRASEKYVLVGRLAAGVAHELGTPLSVVDGHAQRLLRDTGHGDARHRDALLRIREAASRMSDIVQQLLGFGREASRSNKPVSINRLLTLAVADARGSFERLETKLELHEGPDATINVDESRMREAIGHLLKNAAHAANRGTVRVAWSVTRTNTCISVEDSGQGIAPQDRERIFDPFHTTKPAGEGSGLGLTIVHGIVADHSASISVHDSPLGGAAFRIEFENPARCT